jgi:hypothetical protein
MTVVVFSASCAGELLDERRTCEPISYFSQAARYGSNPDLDMETAELLVDFQVFDIQIRFHGRLPSRRLKPET